MILFVIGWLFVAFGVVGIVTPLVPTTPFLLVSLMCFSRSSPRFHSWLFNHRVLGKTLRDWQNHRRIPPYAIVFAVVMLSISAAVLFNRYYVV